MAHLKYYADERKEYNDSYNQIMTPKNAMIVLKKLCTTLRIADDLFHPDFTYFKGHGHRAFVRKDRATGLLSLHLPRKEVQMGLLVHEIAHIYDYHRYGKSGHNKTHKRSMKKIMGIVKRRKYEEKYCTKREPAVVGQVNFNDDVAVIENVLRGLKK